MRGAVKRPPRGFFLDGRRLRLWFIAAGRIVPLGVTLGLGPSDEPAWPGVGSALAGAGIPAALVGPRGGGPAYRIVGRRRLFRLIELLGERPSPVPAQAWPDQ
jgi:hypothetical protein